MYIWTAIEVEDYLRDVRSRLEHVDSIIGCNSPTLTLPLHVSLKISFYVDDNMATTVINALSDYLERVSPFTFNYDKVECFDKIVWIKALSNKTLASIHNDLDNYLLNNYNIPLHDFDESFVFHTSLIISKNKESARCAFNMLQDVEIIKNVRVKKFIVGTSCSGKAGTFKVIRTISI